MSEEGAGGEAIVAVLAGGRGTRLSGRKPITLLAGKPLISYPLVAAAAAKLDAIVVAKTATPLPPLQTQIVYEPDEPSHPLCGLIAALEFAGGRAVLALACDMPLLSPQLLAYLADLPGPASAHLGGRIQPLLSRYTQSQLPALKDALERRQSLTATIEQLGARIVSEQQLSSFGDFQRLCFNVNSDEDLALAERWLAEGA